MGVCAPTVVAVIVWAFTTSVEPELVIELVPQLPVPPDEVAVTVNGVEPPGVVAAFVVIVRVEVLALLVTVVGLNASPAPVGSVPLNTRGTDVQVPLPLQVTVTKYVAEVPGFTGFGVCVPTVTAVIVRGA